MPNISVGNKLREYWQELIYLNNIEIHANFFSVGGDELLFQGLVHKVQRDFNILPKKLNPTNFSTLYQQERLIKKHLNVSPKSIIVPLQDGADDLIIVLIHPIGGSLFPFVPLMKLIKKMHKHNKIYGIQDCAMAGDMRYFDSLSELASFYSEELQKFTQGKKLILIGYSAGGSIANEMAYQLIQKHVDIRHLVLFDSWTKMPSSISFRNSFISIMLRQFNRIKPYSFFSTQEQINAWLEILWNRMRLLFTHKPRRVAVNTTLFVPVEPVQEYTVEKEMIDGWSQYVKDLDIHYVKGNHENMLDKHLMPIVNQLLAIFRRYTSDFTNYGQN